MHFCAGIHYYVADRPDMYLLQVAYVARWLLHTGVVAADGTVPLPGQQGKRAPAVFVALKLSSFPYNVKLHLPSANHFSFFQ